MPAFTTSEALWHFGLSSVTKMVLFLTLLLTSTASGETVNVKNRGPVDLRSFTCTATQSSFVHRACYNEDQAYLVLLLQDTYYDYCGVPVEVHSALLRSSSKGRFFNSYIKNRFYC